MRLHLILPFLGWLFLKTFSGVFEQHKKFCRLLRRETGFAIFIWAAISVISTIFIVLVTVFVTESKQITQYAFLSTVFVSVSYFLCTGFSLLFNDFLEERQELFEQIRRSDEQQNRV